MTITDPRADAPEARPSDRELLAELRDGDERAFATLWSQYRHAALAYSRSLSTSFDPEDVVAEAFSRVLRAIRNGNGPDTHFLEYVRSTVRSTVISWWRRGSDVTLDDAYWSLIPQEESEYDLSDRFEVVKAFNRLPASWQRVLWQSEVLGMKAEEIARASNKSIGATYVVLHRARKGLRDSWDELDALAS